MSPFRRYFLVLSMGIMMIMLGTAIYSLEEQSMVYSSPGLLGLYRLSAVLYLVVLLAGLGVSVLGAGLLAAERALEVRKKGFAPLSPWWVVPYILSVGRYRNSFILMAGVYAVLYAIVTSMIVYQPAVDFGSAYGVAVPSASLVTCCGPPMWTPIITVYLSAHLGLLLIPLTMVLLVAVSGLVGLNGSLVLFSVDSRTRPGNRSWLGGLGAMAGLFTGCPTCAGLFFANAIGGTGAVYFATAIASYQPIFVLLALPVLIFTLYLGSRNLSKVFKEGCVVLQTRR